MRFAVALLALASSALAQSSSQDSSASSASASKSSAAASRSSAASSASSAFSAGQSSGSSAASAAQASVTASLSPCAATCIAAAVNATDCKAISNVTCVCTDPNFQSMATSCLKAECQPSEVGAAQGLQQQQCGALHLSPSLSATNTAPFTPSNSAADISGSPSSSSSNKPSAAAPALWSGNGIIFALGVAVFGGVVGAVVV